MGYFIENNPNTKEVEGLSFGKAHSDANQNINNLKYVENDNRSIENKSNFLKRIYFQNGVRHFNKVEEK